MVCSHCKQPGHTYITCPTISIELKTQIQKKNKEKKELSIQRKNSKLSRLKELEKTTYEVSNMSNYEMVLYWGYLNNADSQNPYNSKITLKRFDYIKPYGTNFISCIKKYHILVVYPFFEVQYKDTVNSIESIQIEYNVNETNEEINHNYICAYFSVLNKFDGTNIIIDSDYKPQKKEIDMWRECALKSKFLLDQIYNITGGGKTMKAYENIEVFLDMIEDIPVPKCTEFEKEIAGVPSLLTNIT